MSILTFRKIITGLWHFTLKALFFYTDIFCMGIRCIPGVKAENFKYDSAGGNPQISYCRRRFITDKTASLMREDTASQFEFSQLFKFDYHS